MRIFKSNANVYYLKCAYLRKCKKGILLVPEELDVIMPNFCNKFYDCDYKNCDLVWLKEKPKRFISLIGEEKYGN